MPLSPPSKWRWKDKDTITPIAAKKVEVQDLTVTGTATFSSVISSTEFQAGDGTAADPSYQFTNSPTTGFYREAADSIGVSTAGVGRWKFASDGHFLAVTDNLFDIGAVATLRPRSIYAGTAFRAPDGTAAIPGISWSADQDTGFWRSSANAVRFSGGALDVIEFFNLAGVPAVQMPNACLFRWAVLGGASDIGLARNAAGVLEINSGVAGAFRDLILRNIEIDGTLNHDGTTVGFYGVTPVVRSAAYAPTNVTTDRAYDANLTSLDEVADVLGTLIADLQLTGIIG